MLIGHTKTNGARCNFDPNVTWMSKLTLSMFVLNFYENLVCSFLEQTASPRSRCAQPFVFAGHVPPSLTAQN